MTDTKPSRGRPKGTGIDDRIWLREMERLMRLDPGLRPTSAIKALGVTDPSTIRRLRDKYAAGDHHKATGRTGAPAKPARTSVAAQSAAPDPVRRQRPGPRLVTATERNATSASAKTLPENPPAPASTSAPSDSVAELVWGHAFQSAALLVHSNALAMTAWARSPIGTAWISQQIAINDALVACLREHTHTLPRGKR